MDEYAPISKATPLESIEDFLLTHAPGCSNNYAHMDQGNKLNCNPRVHKLFKRYGYTINATDADAPHQNANEDHQVTVGNGDCVVMICAGISPQFWRYVFHHYIQLKNTTVSAQNQNMSPLEAANGQKMTFLNSAPSLLRLGSFR